MKTMKKKTYIMPETEIVACETQQPLAESGGQFDEGDAKPMLLSTKKKDDELEDDEEEELDIISWPSMTSLWDD